MSNLNDTLEVFGLDEVPKKDGAMQQTDQPDDGEFKGSDKPLAEDELPSLSPPTPEQIMTVIRDLGVQIEERQEKRRLLKIQLKKMVDKL